MPILVVFYVKLVVTFLLCGVVALVLRYRSRLQPFVQNRESAVLGLLLLAMRVVPFVAIFLVLGEAPRGDIDFFYNKALFVLQGKVVYRDFWSLHQPLFSYLLALPLLLWHDPRALVLLMGVGEAICFWLTYRFYRATDPVDAFWKAAVYLLLPGPLIICLLGGQEDIWLWGFGVGALLAWRRSGHDALWVGVIMAVALLSTKVTFVLVVLPTFFLLRNKLRFTGALLAVGGPALALLFAVVGWKFLTPTQMTAFPMSPNLATVLRPFTLGGLGRVPLQYLNWIGMALNLGLVMAVAWRFRAKPFERVFPSLWVITYAGMMLFQPSAMAYYLFVILIVLVFELTTLGNPRQLAILLIMNVLVVVQPFINIYLDQPFYDSFAPMVRPLFLLEYLLQVAFVAGLIYYQVAAWQRLRRL